MPTPPEGRRTVPRPRRRVPGGKSVRRVVRLTPDEDAVLVERAAAAGVTVARLLAESALGTAPAPDKRVATGELFAWRRQLAGLCTNLNQLAASANSGVFVSTPEVAEVLDEWPMIRARLDAILDSAR